MVIWYDILFAINIVSKKLQSKSMSIGVVMNEVQGMTTYFEKYRIQGFESSLNTVKILALDMDIEPTFPIKCRITRKRQSDENENDVNDEEIQSAKESFRVNYFLVVVDIAIASLKDRFEQLEVFDNIFDDLFSKLKVLQMTLPNDLMSAFEILEFVKDANCYPNVSIAYRILLTMPVTVASAIRSFSKLKLLKTYLRSSMSQERLNGLATLCI
ncbi:zinc finger MYM-type protein 1-like [Chenopodium quinoa]|uniref:zinc finger MYM-type protein 1-like n=1 Tax=Chenopodium quinoa TaxID=63459 RepID=UPI000B7912A3|nr:zinc finger MYM-type protein 1-like [Chenopodium quinoa]